MLKNTLVVSSDNGENHSIFIFILWNRGGCTTPNLMWRWVQVTYGSDVIIFNLKIQT